jgi:hypothetical protein
MRGENMKKLQKIEVENTPKTATDRNISIILSSLNVLTDHLESLEKAQEEMNKSFEAHEVKYHFTHDPVHAGFCACKQPRLSNDINESDDLCRDCGKPLPPDDIRERLLEIIYSFIPWNGSAKQTDANAQHAADKILTIVRGKT